MTDEFDEESPPRGDMVCRYLAASGTAHTSCVVLGRRHWEGFEPDPSTSDFHLLVNEPTRDDFTTTHLRWRYRSYITGIWCSPSGRVFMSDATDECIRIVPDIMNHSIPPQEIATPSGLVPEGIWGLNEEVVFIWGARRNQGSRQSFHVASFDGTKWTEYAPLQKPVSRIHGVSMDTIYVVGWQGLIAKLTGTQWTEFPGPTREILSDVHVVGWDEMYAVGEQGTLLEGSASGWGHVASNPLGPLPFASVRKFDGELYLGAQSLGLMKRTGNSGTIEVFKPTIDAGRMEAGDNLIISCREMVAGSFDGVSFTSCAQGKLAELTNAVSIDDP